MKNISRIFDFIYYQLENHPLDRAFVMKKEGQWEALSTRAFLDRVNQLSRGLLKLGIAPNDKIAVVSTSNQTEWNILDIALQQIGAQNVPIYPTSSVEAYSYILNHSEASYIFVSDETVYKKAAAGAKDSPVKEIYSFTPLKNCRDWEEIFTLGQDKSLQKEVDERKKRITPDDLATLIYTSGTTGRPKGVMLTHKNIVSNVLDSAPRVPFRRGTEVVLSFLPICHVFERMINYLNQYYSVSIYYAESIDALADNIKEVRPTFMVVVPRVLEKVYAAFYEKGNNMTGLKRRLFHWAVNLGKHYEPYDSSSAWYRFRLKWAQKLVLSKWKEGVGGRLGLLVSGSASLTPELARIYAASGMLVLEGYGLTETSPVIAVNASQKGGYKIGTVGKAIDKVHIKIDKDGEILAKGPNIMKGYFKDPEKTKASFTEEGYFRTGDIGEIDEDGFLKITDRKKQLFKTSGGKYIIPQKLETEFKKSPFIEQIIIIGEGEKMPAALIQPDFEFVGKWAKRKEIDLGAADPKSMATHKKVIARIQQEIDTHNAKFGHWEQVKAFRLTPDEWTIDHGQLTPTLKVKRKNVLKIYQSLYDSIYREK